MTAAIYSSWLSNQPGEGGISSVQIEAVLVDFIVQISAQSFSWHAEFGAAVVQFKKCQSQSEFWLNIPDPFCRKSLGRRAASVTNSI